MLNDKLLSAFIGDFYGYGHEKARYWFVGLEEGGGNSEEEVRRRLNTWARFGRPALVDLRRFHEEIGIGQWFAPKPKIQPVWNKLIRFLLSFKGLGQVTREEVREYQRDALGGADGETSLVELLPLPSPGVAQWPYSGWSDLACLESRSAYREAMIEMRVSRLRKLIRDSRAEWVVCYGRGEREAFEKLAGSAFKKDEDTGAYWTCVGETPWVLLRHPVSRGVRNRDFDDVGERMRDCLVPEEHR